MNEIHFAGQLTEDDYRSISSLASRKLWLFSGLIILILVIYTLWSGGIKQFQSDLLFIVVTWFPVLLIFPVILIFQRFFTKRQWQSNKLMQQPVKGTITEEGITWDIKGFSSNNIPWNLLLGYRETSGIILIYQGYKSGFLFFPKLFFG